MNNVASRPRVLAAPDVRAPSSKGAVTGALAGIVLTALAGVHLTHEVGRQRILAPLAAPGGWQKAMVASGVEKVAEQAETAAQSSGDAASYRDGAAVLGWLVGATADPQAIRDLQERSLALALSSLEIAPGSAQGHLLAGAASLDLGKDEARGAWHLTRAVALDPHGAPLRRQLGLVALARGWDDEAQVHFQAAMTVDPGESRGIFEFLDLFDTSLDAVAVTPRTVAAQVSLGRWLQDQNDMTGAGAAYTAALQVADAGGDAASDDLRRWSYRFLIGHLFRQKAWPAAIDLATDRLQSGRYASVAGQALLLYHRGRAHQALGQRDQALADLTQAVTLNGSTVSYADALAGAYAALGRHDEATSTWATALARPRRSQAEIRNEIPMRLRRARSLLADNQPRPAMDELRRILQKNPTHAQARRMLEELGL